MRVFLRVCVCWLLQSKQHSNIFACRWDSFLLLTMVLMEEDYRVLHTLYMLYYYQIQGSNASGKNKPGILRSFACFDIQHILVYYYEKRNCFVWYIFSAISIFFENRPVNSVRVEKKQIVWKTKVWKVVYRVMTILIVTIWSTHHNFLAFLLNLGPISTLNAQK